MIWPFENDTSAVIKNMAQKSIASVSYTHLDVYKRQLLFYPAARGHRNLPEAAG